MKVTIRKADKSDSSEIIRLIKELAEFEKLEPPDKLACRRLIKDAFSINPPFEILVAENYQNILAYAFYFYTYSTFRARKNFVSGRYLRFELVSLAWNRTTYF